MVQHLDNMKQAKYENFIGIYDDYFTPEFCDQLIEYYEWSNKTNKTYERNNAEIVRSDISTNLNPSNVHEIHFNHPNVSGFLQDFNQIFWDECYADYIKTYSTLQDYSTHTIYSYKIQKTLPAQGYHVWHCEDGSISFSRRTGVYILYLNDVEEGGETEFLYHSKRIAPKKGRLIVFPPNYPWTHRGNPPLSGAKYIMTGWLEFQ